MTTVLFGVLIFTLIILALVVTVLGARAKLVASGEVSIVINDDPKNTLKTPAGSTLLNTLSASKIFIPSACGGKGSCGVCKVNVLDGGGAMLPTEGAHITRGEATAGCRLSCQVKVALQLGQRERRGRLTDSPSRGRRWIATFRKEPTKSPIVPHHTRVKVGGIAASKPSYSQAKST